MLLLFNILLLFSTVYSQEGSNPFDLTPRLDPAELLTPAETIETELDEPQNPFDLSPRLGGTVRGEEAEALESPIELPGVRKVEELEIESQKEASTTSPSVALLTISLGLLGLTALVLIFLRSLYGKIYRALFNDNLLSQLYREREAGAIGSFLLTYLIFFLGAAFFLQMTLAHFGYTAYSNFWQQYLLCLGAVSGVLIFKHFLLALLGYIFPTEKETRRYSFTIMIFSIMLGLLFVVAGFLLAFTPSELHRWIILGIGGLVILTYLLRTLRGLFIANRFVFSNTFHFLSYICAVEIGPALCLFKFLSGY